MTLRNPTTPAQEHVTGLLVQMREGDAAAFGKLMPLVYEELRDLAHQKLHFEREGHTLNTTALVHEAYLRLVDQRRVQWQSRGHFFAVAAQAMRRILVNYALQRKAVRRGGGVPDLSFDEATHMALFSDERTEEVLALDEALQRMEAFNERGCRVVEYRFFVGLTYEEIADVMGVSIATVRRAWTAARMWLKMDMKHVS